MKDETMEQLLLQEAKVVLKYLIKIGASQEDAEDIVQETLYKTLGNIDSIAEDKVKAWLFKVAINSYYNLYNKMKRQSNIPANDLHNIQILTGSTEEYFLNEERRRRVQEALDSLKPAYKNLLVLKYFMDLSYKDIATILETSEDQVKVYLYRARNKFKEIWEGLDHD